MPPRPAAERARLRSIWTLLRWQRRVTNAEVRAVTGVETVQASRLLSGMQSSHPTALELDRSDKCWNLIDAAPAREAGGNLDEYLVTVAGAALDEGWIRDARPSFLVPDEQGIAMIRQACLDKTGIEVLYASMNSAAETRRTLFPQALVRTAARWHVRAWCVTRGDFIDVNVGRMSEMRPSRAPLPDLPVDTQWENRIEVRIIAHPDLTAGQDRAVRKEYFRGTAARRVIERQALVPYLLQDLRVATDPVRQKPPEYLLAVSSPIKGLVFRDSLDAPGSG